MVSLVNRNPRLNILHLSSEQFKRIGTGAQREEGKSCSWGPLAILVVQRDCQRLQNSFEGQLAFEVCQRQRDVELPASKHDKLPRTWVHTSVKTFLLWSIFAQKWWCVCLDIGDFLHNGGVFVCRPQYCLFHSEMPVEFSMKTMIMAVCSQKV